MCFKFYVFIEEISGKLLLNEMDISKIDFSKPIYIRQKAAYYKLNKVKFKVGSLAKVEAIKINL